MRLSLDTPVSPRRAIIAGLLLVAPGAWFLAANLLNDAGVPFLYAPFASLVGDGQLARLFNVISPLLFLGGPALALALNALAIGRYNLKWEGDQFVGSVAVLLRPANLAVLMFGALVLAAFIGYAFVENFTVVLTHV